MTSPSTSEEPTIRDRVDERPVLKPRKIAEARPRDMIVRFVAGALTSVVAGAITIAFGPRVGGILLAFPAILAASLTLIEEQENSADAREDARGAALGGCALTSFAIVAALTFGHVPPAVALLSATGAWVAVALLGYLIAWWR